MLTAEDVRNQSVSCYKQWAPQWRMHAKANGTRFVQKSLEDFSGTGVGKVALCIANGYSLQENIDIVRDNQGIADIIVADKALKHCLDYGIKPKICVVCDANVSFDYLNDVKDQVKDVILISNVCANPRWSVDANWKSVYFFVNKDIIKSELEFSSLSGCPNIVAAATNVSNQMVVLLTQSENDNPRNAFGYDKYLLLGFDYAWDKSYYAFDTNGAGRANYMKNIYLYDLASRLVTTSSNLYFSAQWFDQYVKAFNLPVYQTSDRSIIAARGLVDLAEHMRYFWQDEDSRFVPKLLKLKKDLEEQLVDTNKRLTAIADAHRRHAS